MDFSDLVFTFYLFKINYLHLSCDMQTLSCSMWDLVTQPGVEPRPPVLGAPS